MIYGIGTDLCDVRRIEATTVQRFEPSPARGESAAITGTDVSWAARMAANDDKATIQAVGA